MVFAVSLICLSSKIGNLSSFGHVTYPFQYRGSTFVMCRVPQQPMSGVYTTMISKSSSANSKQPRTASLPSAFPEVKPPNNEEQRVSLCISQDTAVPSFPLLPPTSDPRLPSLLHLAIPYQDCTMTLSRKNHD